VTAPLHRLGVAGIAAGYAARDFRPRDLVDHMLTRIAEFDPKHRAFIQVDEAGARQAAVTSEGRLAAGSLRPLEGIMLAVKANIDVHGLETSAGMAARRGMIAAADAEAVARLRAAGAIILGTLNMHEAALGADNDNPWFGRAINPHGVERTPGGSSGGSAIAVAAGLCAASLGTDTLGSVRIPAAYCGVYGLKPTAGAVSQRGLELVAERFDTIGPLARSIDDLQAVYRVLADPGAPQPITRITLLRNLGGVRCEAAILSAYHRAVEAVRQEGLEVDEQLQLELKRIRLAGFVQASRELGGRLRALRDQNPAGFSQNLLFLLDYGAGCSEADVSTGSEVLKQASQQVRSAIGTGALLLPTAPQAAFRHGTRSPANQADFTALASIAGLPALSIPAGTDEDGMPVGIQIVGAPGNDLGLLALARRLEPHLGGFLPPPIF
jgi:aspartyl-tRNA(Asn)/glutamyl-tRNA(Gln) amidotransferase subunit A